MPAYFSDKLKSDKRGLVWPAGAGPQAAMRLSILHQMEESQWWPPEMVEQHQLSQFTELVRHAAISVPYYREQLKKAGWNPHETLTRESVQHLPVLTRADVNEAGARLNAERVPDSHGPLVKTTTSGSTGMPVSVFKTGWSRLVWDAITLRDHDWQQRDLSGTLAIIRHLDPGQAIPPRGIRVENWGPPASLLYTTGKSYLLNIRSTASEQLEWLLEVNPDYLLTFPSAAEALARLSMKQGRSPSNLREVRTLGETLSPETRMYVKQAWDVPIVDCYSAQEIGYIALQAPGSEHYLVQAESVYVEILDANDRPCKPGEQGRVVVTSLQNFATPLIRYALDDFAELGTRSSCGRGLQVLNRILGRSRNMLVLPEGERRFASLGIKSFNSDHGERIRGYQVIQETTGNLRVKLVMTERFPIELEDALKQHICTRVKYPFTIHIEYVDDIPRSTGGKYEDFRCEVPVDQRG